MPVLVVAAPEVAVVFDLVVFVGLLVEPLLAALAVELHAQVVAE